MDEDIKKVVEISIIAAFCLGMLYFAIPESKPVTPTTFNPVEDTSFSINKLDGSTVEFQSLEGRVVLLHFWASWCPPCHKEFPPLLELAGQQKDNIWLIAISVDEEPEKAKAYVNKLKEKHPEHFKANNIVFGLDEDKKISKDRFQTVRYPETIIFNTYLEPVKKVTVEPDLWLSSDMQYLIRTMLQKY